MHFTTLVAATALAGLGQAFLLPPTISSADSEIVNTLPFEDVTITEGVQLALACPGCPVGNLDIAGNEHVSTVKNVLQLDFQIVKGETDKLQVNGLQIYPIEPMMSNSFMETLTAPQLIQGEDGKWNFAAEPALGYSMGVKAPVHSDKDDLDLVTIHMEIVEVGNAFIQGVPAIEISLVRTSSGKLMLGNAVLMPVGAMELTPSDGDQECATVVCKWRAIIAAKLAKLKGCHKSGKAAARPNASIDGPKDHDARPRPHHGHRPHGHNHHNRHRHTLLRFLRNVSIHVLLPIAIGVAVGITASLVGMLIGNVIVFIWRTFFRRNTQYQAINPEEVILIVEEESDDDSKMFLVMEEQGPPPSYTDEKA